MAQLDIVLPAYNPLPGWEDIVIQRFLSFENQLPGVKLQLILVNDGSTTIDEAISRPKLQKTIPSMQWITYSTNRGKGFALRKGIDASASEYIIYTDIDWPYTEDSMLRLWSHLSKGTDAVIGIRDQAYYDLLPASRRRVSRMLRKLNAALLRLKVDDTQAGLKGFKKNIKHVFLQTSINRYLFDLEFIYLLSKMDDIKILGLPIQLRQGITFSKMNQDILLREARNFLKIWLLGSTKTK